MICVFSFMKMLQNVFVLHFTKNCTLQRTRKSSVMFNAFISMLCYQCLGKKNILTWLFDLLCPSEYLCIIVCVLTNEMRSHSRLTHKPPRRSILSDTCIHSLTFVEHKLNASRFSITGNTERTKFMFSCINSK